MSRRHEEILLALADELARDPKKETDARRVMILSFARRLLELAAEEGLMGDFGDGRTRKSSGLGPVFRSEPEQGECVAGGAGERRGEVLGDGPKKAWFGVGVGCGEGA